MSQFKKYGLTEEEYLQLVKASSNTCYICGRGPKTRALAIDHDHSMGFRKEAVRGLLCHFCNRYVIGKINDPDVLQAGADYLRRYKNSLPLKKRKADKLFKFSKKVVDK